MNTYTNKTIKQSASKIWKSCNAVLKSHQDQNTTNKSDEPKPSTSQNKKKSTDGNESDPATDGEGESETMTEGDSPKQEGDKNDNENEDMTDTSTSKDVENGSTTENNESSKGDVEMTDVDGLVTSGTDKTADNSNVAQKDITSEILDPKPPITQDSEPAKAESVASSWVINK